EQLAPSNSAGGIERQTIKLFDTRIEPVLHAPSAAASWHSIDAEANFAEDNRVDCNLALIAAEPVQHLGFGCWACGFAEHVGINEKSHRNLGGLTSSVVSAPSSDWNQPFSGQLNSQSTTPSWLRRGFSFNRYRPWSTRSTSNSWPASMWSRWRSSAGRT